MTTLSIAAEELTRHLNELKRSGVARSGSTSSCKWEDTGIVKVTQGQGEVAYNSFVFPGSRFTIVGEDNEGTLSDQISISINGLLNTTINTNCDNPIGPGLVSGLFMVVNGESKDGGELCPVADMPDDDDDDDDEVIID